MKNWKLKLAPAVIAITTLIVPVLGTAIWTDIAATEPDRDPPVVMVHPPEPLESGAPVTIGAQIVDPSGIGQVVLWVRGEMEDEFRQIPMEPIGEGHVQAELAPWPELGSYVAYYIEARDGKGNGPGYAGAPRTPYVIRVQGAVPVTEEAGTNWTLWAVTAGCLLVIVGGYFLYQRAARGRLHAELNAELNGLTGVGKEAQPAAKPQAVAHKPAKPRVHVPQNPAEQAFWIGLLAPLREMDGYDREHALKNMAVRGHHHPTLGKRFFDVGTLTRHLEWVERGDIQVTAEMVADDHPLFGASETEP